jgi:hypothetical protein
MTITQNRIRKNFMLKVSTLEEFEKLVPAGKRSQFVDKAIKEAMIQLARKKSGEWMDEFSKNTKHKKMTQEETLKEIRYGLS